MVHVGIAVAVDGHGRVVDIVIEPASRARRLRTRFASAVELHCRGSRDDHRLGTDRIDLLAQGTHRGARLRRIVAQLLGQSRFGHHYDPHVAGSLVRQIEQIPELRPLAACELLLVAIHIGLHHGHFDALGLGFI